MSELSSQDESKWENQSRPTDQKKDLLSEFFSLKHESQPDNGPRPRSMSPDSSRDIFHNVQPKSLLASELKDFHKKQQENPSGIFHQSKPTLNPFFKSMTMAKNLSTMDSNSLMRSAIQQDFNLQSNLKQSYPFEAEGPSRLCRKKSTMEVNRSSSNVLNQFLKPKLDTHMELLRKHHYGNHQHNVFDNYHLNHFPNYPQQQSVNRMYFPTETLPNPMSRNVWNERTWGQSTNQNLMFNDVRRQTSNFPKNLDRHYYQDFTSYFGRPRDSFETVQNQREYCTQWTSKNSMIIIHSCKYL